MSSNEKLYHDNLVFIIYLFICLISVDALLNENKIIIITRVHNKLAISKLTDCHGD